MSGAGAGAGKRFVSEKLGGLGLDVGNREAQEAESIKIVPVPHAFPSEGSAPRALVICVG